MTPSKYNNRLHVVCRECGAAVPLASSTPAEAVRCGELWLTPGGELLAHEEPTKCPACFAAWRGFTADSGAEARRYAELLLLLRAGQIRDLVVHPRYQILPAFRDREHRYHRATDYEGDFAYWEAGGQVVEDVKGGEGTITDVFRLKQKMFLHRYRNMALRIVEA